MSNNAPRPAADPEMGDRRCSFCHATLAEGQGVGSGSVADGIFCNLNCYAMAFPFRVAQGQRKAKRRSN